MPKVTIDGQTIEVEAGQNLLQAARKLGIDIPSLCFLESCGPMNSCQVCVVKIRQNGSSRIVPSCGTLASDDLVVESEIDEVRSLRRTALELLLSDHVGDCLSPCHRICPLDLNIPRMIRQIEAGQTEEAVATVRAALALPETLGWLCSAPCENGCRRSGCGGSAAIRDLERYVAHGDREGNAPHLPPRKASTGKSIAILGAGPTGLAAAYHLLRQGHDCTLYDRRSQPGGTLLATVEDGKLPKEVLEVETRHIVQMGAEFRGECGLGEGLDLEGLLKEHDAVLLATGEANDGETDSWGLASTNAGVRINVNTFQTVRPGVFAAGSVVRTVKPLVRAMSEGQSAAECIHQFLIGLPIQRRDKPFSSIMGRVAEDELQVFLQTASKAAPVSPSGGEQEGYTSQEARDEAARCLHCDCRAAGSCDLQHYAEIYGANPNRFSRQRRAFRQELHPADVLFEPGKCILCGICIHLAREAAEPLGLTFVGRGFDVQVAAPLNHSFAEGLREVAAECVANCPTGAIVFKRDPQACDCDHE